MTFKANFHTELFFFCVHKMITSCKYRWQCFILVNAVVFQECQQLVLELFIFPDSQIHTLLYSSSKIVHTVKFFINSGWKQNVLRSSLLVKIIWQCSTLPPPVLKCVILKCTVVLQQYSWYWDSNIKFQSVLWKYSGSHVGVQKGQEIMGYGDQLKKSLYRFAQVYYLHSAWFPEEKYAFLVLNPKFFHATVFLVMLKHLSLLLLHFLNEVHLFIFQRIKTLFLLFLYSS